MTQKYTIIFDLDGTLVDTAPDLMNAHNHVMKKYGYPTKSTEEIRNLVGQGAGAMIGRSIWGQAKKEFSKIDNQKYLIQLHIQSNHKFQFFLKDLLLSALVCLCILPLKYSEIYTILKIL